MREEAHVRSCIHPPFLAPRASWLISGKEKITAIALCHTTHWSYPWMENPKLNLFDLPLGKPDFLLLHWSEFKL